MVTMTLDQYKAIVAILLVIVIFMALTFAILMWFIADKVEEIRDVIRDNETIGEQDETY